MAIKAKTIKCPECQGSVEFDKDRNIVYCSYCGNKIIIENTNEHITIKKTVDEAAIKRAETTRDVQIKKIESDDRKFFKKLASDEEKFRFIVKYGVIATVCLIACITVASIVYNINQPKHIEGNKRYTIGSNKVHFEETILGQAEKKKELIVYTQGLTAEYTVTQEGLFSLPIFKKSQRIDFAGKVTYSIDLSRLRKEDITVNDKDRTITLNISSSELKQDVIYLPEDTKCYDIERGSFLAFGDIKMTAEERTQLDASAVQSLRSTIDSDPKIKKEAKKYAEQSISELFQPVIDYAIESSGGDIPSYTVKVRIIDVD